MKYKILFIIYLFLLFSCNINNKENNKLNEVKEVKNMEIEKKINFITLEQFNKKYSYWTGSIQTYISILEYEILDKYLKNKEKNLLNITDDTNIKELFKELGEKNRIKQILKLIIEMEYSKYNWAFVNRELYHYLLDEVRSYDDTLKEDKINRENVVLYKEEFFKFLEENFTEEELEILIKKLTFEEEHEYYLVDGTYGLPKVDKIITELKKVIPLTSEQWAEREGSYTKTFENEEYIILGLIYILSNNKVVIVNENKKVIKEIKVKDYNNIEVAVYKNIIYLYDDGKIYEYPLDNLEDVKVFKVEDLNLI